MAHELALKNNGQHAMAFVGETPWHGLGQELTIGAPIETWIKEAGFDWSAMTAAVTYTDGAGSARTFADKKILFRSDNGAPLSVVGEGYQIVQPREVIEFFRDLTEREGWHLHTAGILRDGRRLWAMASRGGEAEIVKGDKITENLLLATSLDGSLATHAGLTSIRVVCANTLGFSLRDGLKGAKGRDAARVSHRSVFDAEAIKRHIGVAGDAFAQHVETARALSERPCDFEEAREILRGLFGQPVATKRAKDEPVAVAVTAAPARNAQSFADLLTGTVTLKDHSEPDTRSDLVRMLAKGDAREQKSVARVLELFGGAGRGADIGGVAGTRWGLLNAITEHIDHEQGRDATRFEAATFGRGETFKAEALAVLTA